MSQDLKDLLEVCQTFNDVVCSINQECRPFFVMTTSDDHALVCEELCGFAGGTDHETSKEACALRFLRDALGVAEVMVKALQLPHEALGNYRKLAEEHLAYVTDGDGAPALLHHFLTLMKIEAAPLPGVSPEPNRADGF